MEKEQMTPNGIHIAVYVNDEMNEKVRKMAYLNAASKSEIGNIALQEYMEKHENQLKLPILNGK